MEPRDRPHVVVHTAVSLDGATVGYPVDVGRYYSLAGTWREDVTLTGADTILAQEQVLAEAPQPGPRADGPLLAVVDGRGRVTAWRTLRDAGYWSSVLALRARSTRPTTDAAVEEIVTGEDRVDLSEALAELGRRGVGVVRVDSGGGLTGALLAARLVDEVSLLMHPVVAGTDHPWYGAAPLPQIPLELHDVRRLEGDGGLVWLRYDIPRRDIPRREAASAG